MCHGYTPRDRAESDESDEKPAFLNDEAAGDTELLTDGGDDDEDE